MVVVTTPPRDGGGMMCLLASHPEVRASVAGEVDEFRRNNGGGCRARWRTRTRW